MTVKTDVKIDYANRQTVCRVNRAMILLLKKAIKTALTYEQISYPIGVSLTLVDNETIREMNRDYREKDAATDVLSFPLIDFAAGEKPLATERVELGDIVLSLERAGEQASELGHSTDREAAFLCVHSVLHLLGYDHERSAEDEEDMCRRQREIMQMLGL